MKMKKLLFTCAAVAGVSLALGATAFADVIANDAGYSKAAGTYSVASDLSGYVTNGVADQMTIIIIPEAAYNAATINDSDILYIDQTAAGTGIFQNVGILGGKTLADGTYYVKIGGENIAQDGIIVEKFTITTTPQGITVRMGDINGDDSVNASDINPLLQHILGSTTLSGKAFFVADTNKDSSVNASDINPLLQHILGSTDLGTATYVSEQ